MKFSEKLKKLRKQKGFNQEELASLIGVSKRTIQNYENSSMYPKQRDIYFKLAQFLNTDVNYLLCEDEDLRSIQKNSYKYNRDISKLTENICMIFSSGELSAEQMDSSMKAISEAYFSAKTQKINKEPENLFIDD